MSHQQTEAERAAARRIGRQQHMQLIPVRGPSLALLVLMAACSTVPGRGATVSPVRLAASAEATAPPTLAGGHGTSYTIVKAGAFLPRGDLAGLDDGIAGELVFGHGLLPFLSLEGSLGYLAADGRFGATQLDLWAIPAFVNVRASVPLLVFAPYAGVGAGGMYADYRAGSAFSGRDFVTAWDAFAGLEFDVGRLSVGAEYRYVHSGDTKDDFSIEGATASLFVSLPF